MSDTPASSGAVNRRGLTLHARDMLTEDGATALARQIEAYWHSRGHPQVKVWSEPVSAPMDAGANANVHRLWCVRTNLRGGLPPVTLTRSGNP